MACVVYRMPPLGSTHYNNELVSISPPPSWGIAQIAQWIFLISSRGNGEILRTYDLIPPKFYLIPPKNFFFPQWIILICSGVIGEIPPEEFNSSVGVIREDL